MLDYLNREVSIEAILKISNFMEEISLVYENHGIDLSKDIGRKNIVASFAQEHFFSEAIKKLNYECTQDGRSGKSDITIDSLSREVECKIVSETSRSGWDLRADVLTLSAKKQCDFLYLLFDRKHENVALFLFENLNVEDFYKPSPNSRNKARMKFSKALKKCIPLVGDFIDLRQDLIEKYNEKAQSAKTQSSKAKAVQKIDYWSNREGHFKFRLESIDELKRV